MPGRLQEPGPRRGPASTRKAPVSPVMRIVAGPSGVREARQTSPPAIRIVGSPLPPQVRRKRLRDTDRTWWIESAHWHLAVECGTARRFATGP